MEYKIKIEEYESQKIVHTFVKGIMSEKERNHAAIESVRTMREYNISKVIWDIRKVKLDYPLISSHMVVLNLSSLGVQEGDRVAVIYYHDKAQHEHSKLAAHNRGILNINYFRKLNDAIKWLLSKV